LSLPHRKSNGKHSPGASYRGSGGVPSREVSMYGGEASPSIMGHTLARIQR
jgi:hypothetical protein